jgi:hypothetical protein
VKRPAAASLATVWSLIRKDLRLLRPMLLGLLVLQILNLVVEGVLTSPDRASLFSLDNASLRDGTGEVIEYLLIALLAAFVLLAGERDSRTENFLATLPVRPRTVLLTKLAIIAAVVIGNAWLDILVAWGLAWCNPDSFSRRQLTGSALLLSMIMAAALALVAAAHAFWMAFTGRLAWLILVVGALLAALAIAHDPALARFGPSGLVALSHHGTTPLLPWSALALQAAGAGVGIAAGMSLWLRERKPPAVTHLLGVSGRRRGRALLMGLTTAGVFLALLGIATQIFWNPRLESGGKREDEDDAATEREEHTAGRFVFTHRPQDADKVRALARDAEIAYGRVRSWLGAPAIERIDIDLTFSGVELEGLTLGTRVNIDISREPSAAHRRVVMAHELVHVFQHTLSHGARPDQEGELRFIAEGLAEHVVFELYGGAAGRASARRRSAWARDRYRIHLGDLFEPYRFVARYDERWLYDFGQRWIEALVATCGRSAPAALYRNLADPELPKSLHGAALVRTLLQRDRCSYDRVEARYEDGFANASAEVADLPSVRARFAGRTGRQYGFEVQVDAKSGATLDVMLVLRNDPAASPRDFITTEAAVRPERPTRITASAPGLNEPRFQYRVGVKPRGDDSPLFTRWRWSSAERQVTTAMR